MPQKKMKSDQLEATQTFKKGGYFPVNRFFTSGNSFIEFTKVFKGCRSVPAAGKNKLKHQKLFFG